MNRYIATGVAAILAVFAHQGVSQQPLMEPEMALYNFSEMEPRGREGFSAHFVSAATIRMLRAEVTAGTSTTHHNHPDEEMVYVVEGRIRVFSGGNEVELGAGELVVFPAYVDHHYEAIVDSMTIEVFGPGRTFGAPAGMGG